MAAAPETTERPDAETCGETRIRPPGAWPAVDYAELWRYRDLFLFLSWRNIAIRYKQTLFGVIWALVQPLTQTGLFTVVFGVIANMPSEGKPYFLFNLCGMLPYFLFRTAVSTGSQSLVGNQGLVTKVYFPRIWIPASGMMVGLVDFLISLVALVVAVAAYGAGEGGADIGWTLLLAPAAVAGILILALGMGLLLGGLNARYRDVRHATPFLLQCWLFATPIVYSLSSVPEDWRWIIRLNPLTGLIGTFRAAVLGLPVPWADFALGGGVSLLVLYAGLRTFRRMERFFADVI